VNACWCNVLEFSSVISTAFVNLVKDVSCLHNTLDILLAEKIISLKPKLVLVLIRNPFR